MVFSESNVRSVGTDEHTLRLPTIPTSGNKSRLKDGSSVTRAHPLTHKQTEWLAPVIEASDVQRAEQRNPRNERGGHWSRRARADELQIYTSKRSKTRQEKLGAQNKDVLQEHARPSSKNMKSTESLPVLIQQIACLQGLSKVSEDTSSAQPIPASQSLPALQSVPLQRASAKLLMRSLLQDRLDSNKPQSGSSALPSRSWKPTSSTANTLPAQDQYLLPLPDDAQSSSGEGVQSSPTADTRKRRIRKRRKEMLDTSKTSQKLLHRSTNLVEKARSVCPAPAGVSSKASAVEFKVERKVKNQQEEPHETEVSCVAAFRRYMEDGEIHRDSILKALKFAGFSDPNSVWVNELCDDITTCSTLSLEEFMTLRDRYAAKHSEASGKLFARYDPDLTGMVETSKLREMLTEFGVAPMGYVLRDILAEVRHRQSCQSACEINLIQFQWIINELRDRENFSSDELARFWSAFQRFDGNQAGVIRSNDLPAVLQWLGYSLPMSALDNIRNDIGGSVSGTISKRDLLVCLRKVREYEFACVQHVLAEHCSQKPLEVLRIALNSLGFAPEPSELEEVVKELCLLDSMNEGINLDIVSEFLAMYRRCEGFAQDDVDELLKWFSHFDATASGHISCLQVTGMLRQMGYPVSLNVARKLIATVDINGSGQLDMNDFLKLFRAQREHEDRKATLAFQRAAGEGAFEILDSRKVDDALCSLGLSELHSGSKQTRKHKVVFCSQFVSLAKDLRKRFRSKVRSNMGFSLSEVEQLQSEFASYVRHTNGDVLGSEMHKFIDKQLPGMVASANHREQLIALMKVADEEQSGHVAFDAFLRLARNCSDIKEQEELSKEHTAINETGFSVREVAEFRELFLGEEERNSISFSEVRHMLANVIPMGYKNSQELSASFKYLVPTVDGKCEASFPEFLRLMKRALELNIGNLKEHVFTAVAT